MTPEPAADSLRAVTWRRFLSAPDSELLEHLYVPALSRALRYDRCCAYFSSRVLSLAARGFGPFIARLVALGENAPRPAVRLLVNEQLAREDIEALLASGDMTALERKLLKALKSPTDALEKRRLEMLAWLVKQGLLEVRVGLPRRTGGIVHAKFGIITDSDGDSLSFMGSDNETAEAIAANYELLEVRPSWEDPDRAEHYRREFESLWSDEHPHVFTLALPEAVRLKLIKLAPRTAPTTEPVAGTERARAAMVWRFLTVAPYLPEGGPALDATAPVEPWPHQVHVVEDTARAFPAGRLLCDEVGLGKTIEAILVLRRLLAGRGVTRGLLLVPAGLVRQWQQELREKGGLLVPSWEKGNLVHPDGRREPCDMSGALEKPVLLLSREWARLPDHLAQLRQAQPWDLVLLDEAHAARRRENAETAFNQSNLLLSMLRELQLSGHAKGLLLLSATPMQIEPWEPWDLLSVLGVGGNWLYAFDPVREYFDAVATLADGRMLGRPHAERVAKLIASDDEFPPLVSSGRDEGAIRMHLIGATSERRAELAEQLRAGAPLGRRMHRSTRDTLREYHRSGLLDAEPARREIRDEVYEYQSDAERDVYRAITAYIEKRFEQLEAEKAGKGFVMTVYRRRATSSPEALQRSLQRRLAAVDAIAQRRSVTLDGDDETLGLDLDELGFEETIDPGLPRSDDAARKEGNQIRSLLSQVDGLGAVDSKRDRFVEILQGALADGRSGLVFTEYVDTMRYLRQELVPIYGEQVACYSGAGGEVYYDGAWHQVSKSEITSRLESRVVRVLVCTDAASEGLNLQAASALINYDLPWNPSRVEQRIGRIDRIGQKQRVLPIINLFLNNSVDMRVYSALRHRCGLFEHFVGEMQPVLAIARAALGPRPRPVEEIVSDIEQRAEEVRKRPAVVHAFRRSPVMPATPPPPPVSRQHLEEALALLSAPDMPVRAKKGRDGTWRLSGIERKALEVALDSRTLDRCDRAHPLTLGAELVSRIADKLAAAAASWPLVVGHWRSHAFACSEVRWAGKTPRRVGSMDDLRKLLDDWDGAPPAPEEIARAEREARAAARKQVEEAVKEAEQRHRKGLEQQVAAARLRLRRELARHLRLFGDQDLNDIWAARMRADGASAVRCRLAYDRLGNYVEWTPEELADAKSYRDQVQKDAERMRSLAPELQAALDDPRWRALRSLQ